jgi:predicted RND superfamily exporter protein
MLPVTVYLSPLCNLAQKRFCEKQGENNDKRKNKDYQAVNQDARGIRSTALTVVFGFAV